MITAMDRQRNPELMDDPALDERAHLLALRGLERLNAASGAVPQIWAAIRPLYETAPSVSLLDIATGGGDVPLSLARLAASEGRKLHISGTDVSPRAIALCRKRASDAGIDAQFFEFNALTDELPQAIERFDVVTANLFTHHIDPPDVVALLKRMSECAKKLAIVNDLERSWLNYLQVIVATRLLSTSPVVHYDGPTSVRAAYTISEFQHMGEAAGLRNCRVEKRFPCRLLLTWSP